MNEKNFQLAVQLRHELHQHPELSMGERWTKAHLMDFLKTHTTQFELVDRGRWFYAWRRGSQPKKKVAFRAELDALPIEDNIDAPWRSCECGIGHKCGHDGHASALCLAALEIEENGCANDVYLVFQHAEETGAGGRECAELMAEQGIDEVYAYHNKSGYPLDSVIVRNGCVCCASKGMEIRYVGVPAHASTPENGRNPALAIAALINALPALTDPAEHSGLILATVIQVELGERAFGVSAHRGHLLLTIRGEVEEEMDELQRRLEALAMQQAGQYGLECSFAYYDIFPETRNHDPYAEKIRQAAASLGFAVAEKEAPDRGSDDFGYFTKKTAGAMFSIGNGETYPSVHDDKFDYIDEQLKVAAAMFQKLAE